MSRFIHIQLTVPKGKVGYDTRQSTIQLEEREIERWSTKEEDQIAYILKMIREELLIIYGK